MAATTSRNAVGSRLREWRRSGGNWRLKGLLYALSDHANARTVGKAWPITRPRTDREYVNLGKRHAETHEHAIARQLYDAGAIREAETVSRDQYIKRALTNDAQTELDVLWREELLDTVQAGAESRQIARDATTVTTVNAKRGDLPAHEQRRFAEPAGEGSSAPLEEEAYLQISYNCEKFEAGFQVQDELIEQAEIDTIEAQIRGAGSAVENAINRQLLTNAVDNANQDHNTSGNDANPIDLFEAAENVADNDFDPVDSWIIHPEFRTEVADEGGFAGVNWTGAGTVDQDHGVYGVRVFIGSGATYNGLSHEPLTTSNTWGWESGGEIGAVVFGSQFVHTVIYQDIAVSELEPPYTDIRDVQGGVARAWTASAQPSDDAISTITQ